MPRLSRIPVVGSFLEELFTPDQVVYRRYGDREDRDRRLRAQGLAMLTGLTGVGYLTWTARALNWSHPFIAAGFLGAETACFLLFVFASIGAWRLRFKPLETPMAVDPVPVDVFICVCGEPIEIVTRTLEAATRIAWHGALQVYVLDDGGSHQVRDVAGRLGATYRSRAAEGLPRDHAKAGNLNFGLSVSDGTFVLALDADQIPSPHIVERLAPYANLPKVGFVQSKQSFLVPEDDPFYCQDEVFYNSLQPAFDANDAVLSCGSGVLYRRAALLDIGGFATWNLVEDLTTSYELHSAGWKSLYYPYPLAVGLAPDTISGVYRQRGQWALDTMRLFFWKNPLLRRSLPLARRLNYFVIGFSYLTAGFAAPLFFVIPLWSYATGEAILLHNELEFALWRVLYFLTMTLALRWLFRGHQPGKQFQMLLGLFPVYGLNALRALKYRSRKPGYRVNNVTRKRRDMPPMVLLAPQLLLLVGNILGPFVALFAGTAGPRVIAANVVVSALAIWSLSLVCTAAFRRPVWQAERHPAQVYASPARS